MVICEFILLTLEVWLGFKMTRRLRRGRIERDEELELVKEEL